MKNQWIVLGVIVVVLVVGVVVALVGNTSPAPVVAENKTQEETVAKAVEETPAQSVKPAAKPMPVPAPAQRANGSYEPYSPEKVAFAKTGQVILYFHSANCPACVLLDKEIAGNTRKIPADLRILKVDFESQKDVVSTYGVTAPHFFVQVDAGAVRITQWGGSATLSELITRMVRI